MNLDKMLMKQRYRLLIFIFFIVVYLLVYVELSYSETTNDSQITEFLEKNEEIFNNNNIVKYAAREIGWACISFLVWIADACSSLYDTAFGFVDFTSWDVVNKFTESFKPLFFAVMTVSLFGWGIMMILMHDRRPKILLNVCIACFCITCSTVAFQELNSLTFEFKKGIENVGNVSEHESEAYMVVDDSLVDLVVLSDRFGGLGNLNYADQGTSTKKYTNPGITEKNFKYINYTEVLNPKSDQYSWTSSEKEILGKKLYFKESLDNGVVDVKNGFGWNSADDADMANEFYYRYTFAFFTAILQLIAYIVVYICMSYKCTRIAFELVVSRIFAVVYSAELSGGEKISKILVFIRDSYILLITTTLCIRLYGLFNSFITETVDSKVAQVIFLLFAAFCVVDGPNLVEKLLGMDAGLSSSVSRMVAVYGTAKGAASAAMAPAKIAGNYAIRRHEQDRFIQKMTGDQGKDTEQGNGGPVAFDGVSGGSTQRDESGGSDGGVKQTDSIKPVGAESTMNESYKDATYKDVNGFDTSFMDREPRSERISYFDSSDNGNKKSDFETSEIDKGRRF